MKKDAKLFIALAVILAGGFIVSETVRQPRGIRNNNPGNIRHSGSAWLGKSATQTDPEFVQFDSPHFGIRALSRVLRNYTRLHGINTLRGAISRWAPSVENPTAAYIDNMVRWSGLGADEPISFDSEAVLLAVVPGIIRMENGVQPYDTQTIARAIEASA